MSLDTLIANTRKAIAGDAAKAHVVFTAQGTLVGVTEVDIRTGAHSFKVDEPRLAGRRRRRREPGAVRAGVARVLPGDHVPVLGRATRRRHWTRSRCGSKAT